MSEASPPSMILMLGVGRSGTSLITGILRELGFHVPQPEIDPDESNPRGFGEPAWVVAFHRRLMRELRVTVFDARPAAWKITGRVATDPAVREELQGWLREQVAESPRVAVKDPRIMWFLPLWLGCIRELGVFDTSITMLRHPAEILTSARRWYGTWQTDASRAASWLNVMLETERATRGTRRVFLRYEDVLADWRREIERAGGVLGLPLLSGVAPERRAEVDRFVEPGLRRARVGWTELAVPASVRDLAEDAWGALNELAAADREAGGLPARFDRLRSAYVELYEEAEAISQSSVTAVKPRSAPRSGGRASGEERPASGAPTLRARIARRIPKRYRERLRATVTAARRSR